MAQHSKVFFPYDPLPAQDLNDIVDFMNGIATGTNMEPGSITPAQRSGGFRTILIPGSVFGSTGIKNIAGVGFKPKGVIFTVLPSFHVDNSTFAMGSMDEDGNQLSAYTASNGGNYRRGNQTNAPIIWSNAAGTIIMRATYVSMDADGFSINVTDANGSFDVSATCFG